MLFYHLQELIVGYLFCRSILLKLIQRQHQKCSDHRSKNNKGKTLFIILVLIIILVVSILIVSIVLVIHNSPPVSISSYYSYP